VSNPPVRTHVFFDCQIEFQAVGDAPDVLSVSGAEWFRGLLQRIPRLKIAQQLCQEDWGVVFFAARDRCEFWIGLSVGDHETGEWLAHCHHGSFRWRQRWSQFGRDGLRCLVVDLHQTLGQDPACTRIVWMTDREITGSLPGSPHP
jgi:hypothetical protein